MNLLRLSILLLLISGGGTLCGQTRINPAARYHGRIDTIRVADYLHGRTASEAIEAALQQETPRNRFRVVVLDRRKWVIDRAVLLPSRCELLLCGATLKLADGTFDNLIRSAGIDPDPDNPYGTCRTLTPTYDIRITGTEGATIEGADSPYRAFNPKSGKEEPWLGDHYGWRTIGILLAGTKRYEISGITLQNTHCWAISQEWGCSEGYLHDIRFDTRVKNGDGIDFRNGTSRCLVERISGYTSDDTIACTALDNSVFTATSPYLYPMQAMGYEYRWGRRADIRRIVIRKIDTEGLHHGVICLSSSPRVHRILIEEVTEPGATDRESLVRLYTGYGTGYKPGNLNRIIVREVTAQGDHPAVRVATEVKRLTLGGNLARRDGTQIDLQKQPRHLRRIP